MDLRRPILLGSAAAVLLAACSTAAATGPYTPSRTQAPAIPTPVRPVGTPVATDAVGIKSFMFGPAVITVPAGSTVTWTNNDVEQHTVTARDKSFNSDAVASDKTFSVVFSKAGTFEYFCQIHPQMVGIVEATDQ